MSSYTFKNSNICPCYKPFHETNLPTSLINRFQIYKSDSNTDMYPMLYHFLSSQADRRRTEKGNIIYKLSDLLFIGVAGQLAGLRTRRSCLEYARSHLSFLNRHGILLNGVPSEATLLRADNGLDYENLIEEFQKLMMTLFLIVTSPACGCTPVASSRSSLSYDREKWELLSRILAIDGKCLNGTKDERGRSPNVMTAYRAGVSMPISMVACDSKENEIPGGQRLVRMADVSGLIVTADAISCQRDTIKAILDGGGDYVIGLKENQKRFYWDCEDMTIPASDIFHEEDELIGGKIVRYTCETYRDLSQISVADKWEGLSQIVKVTKESQKKNAGDGISRESRYYITSLGYGAQSMLFIIRCHWQIENGLHWRLDVEYNQDRTRREKRSSGLNLDVLVKVAFALRVLGASIYDSNNTRNRGCSAMRAVNDRAKVDFVYAMSLFGMTDNTDNN